jgi:hypothetical protein
MQFLGVRITILAAIRFSAPWLVVILTSTVLSFRARDPLDNAVVRICLMAGDVGTGLVLFLMIRVLHLNVLRWWRTCRVLGRPTRTLLDTMRRLSLGSQTVQPVPWRIVAFLVVSLATISVVFGHILFIAVGVALVLQSALEAVRHRLPPFALLLSSSGTDRLRLQRLLAVTLKMRVASLLDPSVGGPVAPLAGDCFRTKANDWETAVQELASITPVVVIDARSVTGHLGHELDLMGRLGFSYKCVVIVGRRGERPLLDAALVNHVERLRGAAMFREDGLFAILRHISRGRQNVPIPARTIADIVRAAAVKVVTDRAEWERTPPQFDLP